MVNNFLDVQKYLTTKYWSSKKFLLFKWICIQYSFTQLTLKSAPTQSESILIFKKKKEQCPPQKKNYMYM